MATCAYFVVFLSLCWTAASALDCYECNNCESYFTYSSRSEVCQEPFLPVSGVNTQTCYKQIEADGTINRGCMAEATCKLKELTQKCKSGDVNCYICCDTPDCNAAVTPSVSPIAMTFSTLIAVSVALIYRLL